VLFRAYPYTLLNILYMEFVSNKLRNSKDFDLIFGGRLFDLGWDNELPR